MKIKIIINKFNFIVIFPSKEYLPIIEYLTLKLSTYKWVYNYKYRRNIRVVDRTFLSMNNKTLTYRLHINLIRDFLLTLRSRGYTRDDLSIVENGEVMADDLDLKFNSSYTLADYQNSYVDILTTKGGSPFKLVDLIMGKGKTIIAVKTALKINKKFMVFILPKFISKWISDIKHLTNIKDNEIFVMRGLGSLDSLVNEVLTLKRNPYKVVIVSITSFQLLIKEYENRCDDAPYTHSVEPQYLLEFLRIGTVINDETHLSFFAIYYATMYLNSNLFIGLSATLKHADKKITYMYNIMFPGDARISGLVDYNKYIDVHAIAYRINNTKGIKWSRPQGYNHILYEQSILRSSIFLNNYMDMIMYYVDKNYMNRRVKGDKLLIFVASIKLATILTNKIKSLKKECVVNRYVEDDPYENVINADICISTILSAGTAVDIPNLITVIQTVSVDSIQSNEQSYGRLRDLPNKQTQFLYLYCKDIEKQISYHINRKTILTTLTKDWYDSSYHNMVRVR